MSRSQLLVAAATSVFFVACGSDGSGSNTSNGANNAVNSANSNTANASTGPNSSTGGMVQLPFAQCAGTDAPPPLVAAACFGAVDAPDVDKPLAIIEHAYVDWNGIPAVYLRLTFDPDFVDNTFGAGSVGWDGGREFGKLVGSDHSQFVALDASGEVVFELKLDYLGDDDAATCGYSSKGVAEKDGDVLIGEESDVLAWTTSMDRNLNERGYCDYLVDSPVTDANCTPNPDAPNWDFRVVYEIWLRRSAFEPTGFGTAHMTFVHASPAKGGENTVEIVRQDCPCPQQDHECRDFPTTGTNNEPNGDPGDPCTVDADCATNSFCYQGTCLSVIL